jgi:hypothetical protein
MDGDDAIAALANRLDGSTGAIASVPFAVAAGLVNVTMSAVTQAQATVTFPAGRFNTGPILAMTVNGAGASNLYSIRTTGALGAASFNAVVNSAASVSATIPVGWIAVQMTSSAAGG